MNRILVAGIGNIFQGDDAFGVEVARQLQLETLPAAVRVVDFGIRCYDLAYAIADGYDTVVFVDATSRRGIPGTLYLLELDPENVKSPTTIIDGHSLDPVTVLRMARGFDAKFGRLLLVGCEPASLECEEGRLELSAEVAAAVPHAIEMIRSLLDELMGFSVPKKEEPGLLQAATDEGIRYAAPR
jgi:hydrogenase maturation protease